MLLLLLVAYVVLLAFPYTFFSYEAKYKNITVYSDRPISPALPSVLSLVEERLRKSPLNDPGLEHRIFICNDNRRFALFTNLKYRVGGVNYEWLTRNIFLRGANIDRNRLIGPSGREVPGERTLAYFMAHEITHSLVSKHLGRYAYWRLPAWKQEGYADYVARDGDFHFREQLAAFQRDAREMDPTRSGLYLRYQLLVTYLLEIKGITLEALLTRAFNQTSLEQEIRGMK
jgi:hypothetical protein